MRTLQEKYNAIQEGKFSKDHFLAEARMQQPQLVTRFNGYDDAVQILKNKGMIVEGIHDRDVLSRPLSNPAIEPLEQSPEELGKAADSRSENILRMKYYSQIKDPNISDEELRYLLGGKGVKGFGGTPNAIDNIIRDRNSNQSGLSEAKQPKATKKGLADYRYKPTNEMDKYPYEQILRGIRVELEVAGVYGTPTAEEYSKALATVSKNLAKDSIFYTNQVAGVNPKVDLHDKMVPVTAKNSVDTFNGMKKAALKEGFKKLIKKVLSEEVMDVESYKEDVYEMYGSDRKIPDDTYIGDDTWYDEEEDVYEMYGSDRRIPDDTYIGDDTWYDEEEESDRRIPDDTYIGDDTWYDEEEKFELQGDDLDESRMGDVHILAQESNTLKDFLMAVKQQHPEVDIRRDIEELQDIWNNRQEDEIDYDDENFSDPLIDGEDDLFEGQKSLSELLK